uniref:Uncharacterized protein n=1 Tax=viral metagenome TaxID=1070528 RepID=A0A6C0FCD0_9ZZZZ|tara:strand:+ start:32871 stop:34535 length:1665 start_codon:yes stop_codon:yes gene_type:complete
MVKSHYDIINKAIKRTSREKVTHQLLSFAKKHPSKKTYAVKLARATYFGAQRPKRERIPPKPTPVTSPYAEGGAFTLLPPAPRRGGGVKIPPPSPARSPTPPPSQPRPPTPPSKDHHKTWVSPRAGQPGEDVFYDAESSHDHGVKSSVIPTSDIQTQLTKGYKPTQLQTSDVADSEEYRKAVEQARELNRNVELLKTNVSDLKTRQQKLKELNGTLIIERDRLTRELNSKTAEVEKLKSTEEANNTRITGLTAQIDAEKRKLEETELQLANVRQLLETEKAAQLTGLERANELRIQLAAVQERYTTEMEDMRRAQEEAIRNANTKATERLEAALADKGRRWEADRGALSKQIKAEKDKATSIDTELEQLKNNYDALNRDKAAVDKTIITLREELKKERALKETSEGLAKRLSKEVSEREKRLENIRAELTRSNARLEQLKDENLKLSNQATALATQLDHAKKSGQGNDEILKAMILLNNMNAESSIEYKSAYKQYDNDIAKINTGLATLVKQIGDMSREITTGFGKKSKAGRGKKQPAKKPERKKRSERSEKRK